MATAEPALAGRPLAVSREASGTPGASQANSSIAAPSVVLDASAGPTVTVPGGHFLLVADYIREGADLVLVGPDGETVVVRDYFSSDAPPALITEGGARIPPDLAEALAGPAAPAQSAQAQESAAAAPIFQGDVIETGSGASIGVVFVDTTTFSLGEDGRMVMDELVFDAESGEGNSSFSVVQGVFSFVSGQIAKSGSDAMAVRTPVATIGIRGTRVAG